jgi:hypothetical protein
VQHQWYRFLTEKEKTQALFIDDSVQFAGITWKWSSAALQPLSGTSLKDSGECKSYQWAEFQAVHLFVHGQGLEGNMFGPLLIRLPGEQICMWTDLSEWMKNVKIFVFQVNYHEGMTSTEETFHSQVDRMTQSSYLPGHPLTLPNGFMNKVAKMSGVELNSVTWTFTHQGWLSSGHYQVANLPTVKTKIDSWICHHHLGQTPNYLMAGWFHWTDSIMEGGFVYSGIDPYSEQGFAFFQAMLLSCVGLENASFSVMLSTQYCFSSNYYSLSNKLSGTVSPCLWNSLISSHSLPSLIRQCGIDSWRLGYSASCRNNLQGWDFPEDCICSESMLKKWCFFSHRQDIWVQKSIIVNGSCILHCYS